MTNRYRETFEAAPVGMLLVDTNGVITDANRQLLELFQYEREGLIGQPVELLVDLPPAAHAKHRAQFHAQPRARPMGAGRDLFARRRDGVRVPVEIGLTPMQTADGPLVIASVVDLTERKRAQQALEASVHEKELLLKELQHRSKNNLQLIASLLDLASDTGRDVVRECRERIDAIALVHEKLYQAGTVARLELSDYLRTLSEQFTSARLEAERQRISVAIDAADLWISLEHAVPCGLIVNELVTNAFKHAFPGDRRGTVTVRASREADALTVELSDDGIGGVVAPRPGHTGLDLVNALTRQLRGKLTITAAPAGTRIVLRFDSPRPR
ncbi:MAG: PAS domain S-box protein [Myxococcaceae bacterium]